MGTPATSRRTVGRADREGAPPAGHRRQWKNAADALVPSSDVRPTSNGTLGVGQHLFDCQGACEQHADSPGVFRPGRHRLGARSRGRVETTYRLPNPVSYLPGYDDGIVIELPSPPEGGTREVHGTLIFGIGGADLDRLGASDVLHLDTHGRFTTVVGGRSFPDSYCLQRDRDVSLIDDVGLPRCPGHDVGVLRRAQDQRRSADGRHGREQEGGKLRGRRTIEHDWSERVGAADDVAEDGPAAISRRRSSGERLSSSADVSRSSWTARPYRALLRWSAHSTPSIERNAAVASPHHLDQRRGRMRGGFGSLTTNTQP